MTTGAEVRRFVLPGFESVRDEFAQLFARGWLVAGGPREWPASFARRPSLFTDYRPL